MQKPKTTGEWVGVALIGLLSALMAGRGVYAIATQNFVGTTRYSGAYELTGRAAVYMGSAWVFLGLMILCALGLQFQLPRRYCLGAAAACLLAALVCFVVSFTAQ